MHFVYAYIVYQLLRYRTQRDLHLISALLASQPEGKQNPKSAAINKSDPVDSRLYPAVVKLLDTILQSLNQMRTLSVVDDNPDLASAIDARISLTKARR
jgi:signal recognition particle subunit SRP68